MIITFLLVYIGKHDFLYFWGKGIVFDQYCCEFIRLHGCT